ncbi:hypothetical protein MHU86_18305 [Fragilaria crotonensis]|nr:hypothetical protein MHU86_18305 [Fragilaria crotonensis]
MLHLVSLGWFKYCLEAFASQAGGKNSVAVKRYDALCARIGTQLSRHSDRDLPRMNFPKGFSSGTNLMGHEITGCLLVKLFALHTTSFKNIFPTKKKPPKKVMAKHTKVNHMKPKAKKAGPEGKAKKKKAKSKATKSIPTHPDHNLRFECHVSDWILAVSSLLQWHQWMKQPEMPRHQVVKSKYAVQWLMRNVANICPRQTGMGNNTIKNHLVLHICEDILDHGVPENVNSAYAESAHIPLSKMTARNTQKRAKTFTKQAAERYVENLAISSAVYDMECDHASMAREGQQRQRTATHQQISGSLAAGGSRSHGLLAMHVHHSSGFASIQGSSPWRLPAGKAMHYLATYCLPHTGMGSFGVAQSSSPLRDTNTGPIQASMTVNHGMTTPWSSGQTISIPIPPSLHPHVH